MPRAEVFTRRLEGVDLINYKTLIFGDSIRSFLLAIWILQVCLHANASVVFPSDFFFGIANAPAHVEDKLSDIWTDFAEQGGVAAFSRARMNNFFPELIKDHLDFLGLNYYGIEVVKGASVTISDKYEYSDSGRGVSPYGFYKTLKSMHERFNLPIIITENGVADSSDWLRPAYLIEHLKALKSAMDEGVNVLGYVHWTLSDNWEWADGYCPKFGLVIVDRENDLKRIKRPSFNLYQSIIKDGFISDVQSESAWNQVQNQSGKVRDFCRSSDVVSALDEPLKIPAKNIDWRFQTKP